MQKQVITPMAGDSLLIGKYLTGFDRKGKPIFNKCAKGKEARSEVNAVYEDGRVRSQEGDVFRVQLNKRPTTVKGKQGTKHLPAQWVTVE